MRLVEPPVRLSVSVPVFFLSLPSGLSTLREPSQAGWHRAAQRCGDFFRRLAETDDQLNIGKPRHSGEINQKELEKKKKKSERRPSTSGEVEIGPSRSPLHVLYRLLEANKLIGKKRGRRGYRSLRIPFVGRMTQDAEMFGRAQLVTICLGRLLLPVRVKVLSLCWQCDGGMDG